MGRIFAVTNQKGGVGKTTTSVNLAASLAAAEQDVLLVDCDPQGNATSGLGVEIAAGRPTLYDLLIGRSGVQAAINRTDLERLGVIGSNVNLFGAEVELAAMEGREHLLARALKPLAASFRYIFLDCPPSLGLLTLNALTACDAVIIPLQCEYYALEGLTQLLHTVTRVRRNLNPALGLEGIVLTMFDKRNNLSGQVAEDVRRHFGDKVFKTVIPRNVRLSEAPSHGKPALLYDRHCAGSRAYLRLARELLARPAGPAARQGDVAA